MVEMLHRLGVEIVVLGNHEFDFGAPLTAELLQHAQFTQLGSNIRCADSGALFPGVTDVLVLPLANDLRIGVYGVCTTVTGRDPFAGDSVRFEDEVAHARRCIRLLQEEHEVDAVVAITHLDIEEDQRLARQVPGINLLLGGHDHSPFSLFVNGTFIHKSGMDALWLGVVDMRLERRRSGRQAPTEVTFHWSMLANRGYPPDPACQVVLQEYVDKVQREDEAQGKLIPLAICKLPFDGTRMTCRTKESNLGNLIADALRVEMQVDVGLLNAGCIKGDALHPAGLAITRKWLEIFLPLLHPVVVVEMRVRELRAALTHWLRRCPSMNSTFPHVSGLRIEYDATSGSTPFITSMRFDDESITALDEEQKVKVAVPRLPKASDWRCFECAKVMATGSIVRDVVAKFVEKLKQLKYPFQENRVVVVE